MNVNRQDVNSLTSLVRVCITYFNPHFSPEEPATTICARFTGTRSV